jgi:phosphotransferase system enzyme I (PtsI)
MASNPAQVILLLGMGMTDLSMTPSSIPMIRRLVRAIDLAKAQQVAEEAPGLTTPREVHAFLTKDARDGSAVPGYRPGMIGRPRITPARC